MRKEFKTFRTLNIRFDEESYNSLRKLSFLEEKPMAELIRDSLKKMVEDRKKILTNSSIAV